jgi:hypothetical protein
VEKREKKPQSPILNLINYSKIFRSNIKHKTEKYRRRPRKLKKFKKAQKAPKSSNGPKSKIFG